MNPLLTAAEYDRLSRVVMASNCGKGSGESRDAGNNENGGETYGESETKTLATVLMRAVSKVGITLVTAALKASSKSSSRDNINYNSNVWKASHFAAHERLICGSHAKHTSASP